MLVVLEASIVLQQPWQNVEHAEIYLQWTARFYFRVAGAFFAVPKTTKGTKQTQYACMHVRMYE